MKDGGVKVLWGRQGEMCDGSGEYEIIFSFYYRPVSTPGIYPTAIRFWHIISGPIEYI